MRPVRATTETTTMTRRGLAARLAATAAATLAGGQAVASPASGGVAGDPVLRDAALRGLALAGQRGDPVAAAAAQALIATLAATDPEGALLARLYARLDIRPAAYWAEGRPMRGDERAPAAPDLAALHDAIAACRPVGFSYTDLEGHTTRREVLPLALVHPPQGVKLLGFCRERGDYRQFFVRAVADLSMQEGDFTADRLSLLQGLAEKEGA
ncbi:MAG: WYL domain-containing protein [Paracoccus sp. (in: a-proteobacteria)]|nr:WYL domain-containing protein [Paracoccus sp. (in: a-proteobacteria)]